MNNKMTNDKFDNELENHIPPSNCIPFRQIHNARVTRPFLVAKGQPHQTTRAVVVASQLVYKT